MTDFYFPPLSLRWRAVASTHPEGSLARANLLALADEFDVGSELATRFYGVEQ